MISEMLMNAHNHECMCLPADASAKLCSVQSAHRCVICVCTVHSHGHTKTNTLYIYKMCIRNQLEYILPSARINERKCGSYTNSPPIIRVCVWMHIRLNGSVGIV